LDNKEWKVVYSIIARPHNTFPYIGVADEYSDESCLLSTFNNWYRFVPEMKSIKSYSKEQGKDYMYRFQKMM